MLRMLRQNLSLLVAVQMTVLQKPHALLFNKMPFCLTFSNFCYVSSCVCLPEPGNYCPNPIHSPRIEMGGIGNDPSVHSVRLCLKETYDLH